VHDARNPWAGVHGRSALDVIAERTADHPNRDRFAATQHRYGPAALAGGLAISFVTIGLFIATIGFSIGLDATVFRTFSALLLIAIGVILLSPYLQQEVAGAASPLANWAGQRFGGHSGEGLWGQARVGLLLGAVWSPCVGPTLGAASVLASQGKDIPRVSLIMLMLGLGAALPLLILGMLSREAMLRFRSRMMSAGSGAKMALGRVLLVSGMLVISGYDKRAETALLGCNAGLARCADDPILRGSADAACAFCAVISLPQPSQSPL
jgi:cytochrome c-type biogenesis protein